MRSSKQGVRSILRSRPNARLTLAPLSREASSPTPTPADPIRPGIETPHSEGLPPVSGYRQPESGLIPYSRARPPPRKRKWLVPVIAVMVVVIVLIATLFALGLLKGILGNGTVSGSAPPDFGSARTASTRVANNQAGGPWKLHSVYGLAPAFPFNVTINATWFTDNSSCTPPPPRHCERKHDRHPRVQRQPHLG
jgi:hypothetical protein